MVTTKSPVEIVGISFNLFNNSNTTMSMQVLANDWDHVKKETLKLVRGKSVNFSDNRLQLQRVVVNFRTDNGVPGDCSYITKTNGINLNQARITSAN